MGSRSPPLRDRPCLRLQAQIGIGFVLTQAAPEHSVQMPRPVYDELERALASPK